MDRWDVILIVWAAVIFSLFIVVQRDIAGQYRPSLNVITIDGKVYSSK